MQDTLVIKGLRVSVVDKELLKGVDLQISSGEVHAVMGPNGSGKSTLAYARMGHPKYEVTGGTVTYTGQNVLEMEPEERYKLGMFLAFQYPFEIEAVPLTRFLMTAFRAHHPAGRRGQAADELDVSDRDLHPRPLHGPRGQPVRAPHHRRRADMGGHQPRPHAERQEHDGRLGRPALDNLSVEYAGVVFAIAESPIEKGVIWAGTNDGLVHLTRDAGTTWANVTKNLPNLPPWGSFRSIVASRYDAGTAYVAVDFHQVNGRDPFLYKTIDYGRTFRQITNGIPKSMLSYTKVICEDPVRRGLLYAGTENAIYVSFEDGENWQPLQSNLPAAPVSWITVQEHFNDLVISTYGRGFWIMDDVGPLQQMTPQVLASDAHLFKIQPAYRFRPITAPSTPYDDPTVERGHARHHHRAARDRRPFQDAFW